MKSHSGRDHLVLRKYTEALDAHGQIVNDAYGLQLGSLMSGDRMFVVATKSNELYLLGAIWIRSSGEDWAEGKSLFGEFRIIPLKSLKWRLRFEETSSPKLRKDSQIVMQVRTRRLLSIGSAKLLRDVLSDARDENTKSRCERVRRSRLCYRNENAARFFVY